MASQFVRKITDTTINEPIKETTTNGDLIITKDDKVLINLNGTLKDLTAGKDAEMPVIGGRNLVLGTSKQVVQATDWNMQVADIKYDKSLGGTLSASVMIYNADHASSLLQGSSYILIRTFDQSGEMLSSTSGNSVLYNADGLSWASTTLDDNVLSIRVFIRTNNMRANTYYSRLKVERGDIPTDWTPAPEDVDSEIAKRAVDNNVVHKTGTETIAGDKTFSGTTTMTGTLTASQVTATDLLTGFHNVIQVPDTTTTIIDLINNDFIKGRGFWKEATFITYDHILSDAPSNDKYSIIKLSTRGRTRTYVEYSDLSGSIWHTTATTNTLYPWVKQSNNSEVVHNAGNETIAGNKTLTGLTTMLTGNYGLRVTSSGFQKTTDGGKTWVTANL